MFALRLVLTAVLLLTAACVHPAHVEKTSRELAYVESRGFETQIHRCGEVYPVTAGFYLDNVDEAFPEGSKAAEYGRAAEVHAETALWLNVASLAMTITGLALAATADYDSSSGVPGQAWASLGLGVGAAVPLLVSGFQSASAQTRMFDAVNAYNDAVFANPDGACVEGDEAS